MGFNSGFKGLNWNSSEWEASYHVNISPNFNIFDRYADSLLIELNGIMSQT